MFRKTLLICGLTWLVSLPAWGGMIHAEAGGPLGRERAERDVAEVRGGDTEHRESKTDGKIAGDKIRGKVITTLITGKVGGPIGAFIGITFLSPSEIGKEPREHHSRAPNQRGNNGFSEPRGADRR